MADWIETYRGAVAPWECDVNDHLTIAYYFGRFSDANLVLMAAADLVPDLGAETRRGCVALECYVRFAKELRAGDTLHIDSGILEVAEKIVTCGHKVIDSASGAVVATLEEKMIHFDLDSRESVPIPEPRRAALEAGIVEWDGPEREPRALPDGETGFMVSAREAINPWQVDLMGHWNFRHYVHCFSAAGAQALVAFGMTPDYRRAERRGLSTFEVDVRFLRELHVGDLIVVRSALADVGNSSFRLIHKMYEARGGGLAATMSQYGVHLDLETRRPTPLPPELKARALEMSV
jgi:acyl-CoA thioesterase FadM